MHADLVLKRVEEYRAACVAKTEAHEAWLLVSHTRESDVCNSHADAQAIVDLARSLGYAATVDTHDVEDS